MVKLTREIIITTLEEKLILDPQVLAMWEGGSAANARLDKWSDIDLMIITEDEYNHACIENIGKLLQNLSPIEFRFRLPEPTWHGHLQEFIKLRDTEPCLLMDYAVLKRSSPNRFLETERHGKPVFYFDKINLPKETHVNRTEFNKRVQNKINELSQTFPMFQPFVLKELERGNPIDAFGFYYGLTLRPLIELLGIKYRYYRFDYGMRYLHTDLPDEMQKLIQDLVYVRDSDDLRTKHARAGALFKTLIDEISV